MPVCVLAGQATLDDRGRDGRFRVRRRVGVDWACYSPKPAGACFGEPFRQWSLCFVLKEIEQLRIAGTIAWFGAGHLSSIAKTL
jgi:hypothetical protein